MELIIAAISLGLLGSFHCIGMCGPIALALPVHQYSLLKKYVGIFLYNLGRVIIYTFLGLVWSAWSVIFFRWISTSSFSHHWCIIIVFCISNQYKMV